MTSPIPGDKILIQFDGMCVLCSRTVRIILKADRHKKFIFQTISVENKDPETVVVWHKDICYQYFDAVFKIGKELGGIYRLAGVFSILPEKWRKKIYLWIAGNRFKWFGRRQSCYIPTEDERHRFI